jgi:hypothetical protein
MGQPNEHADSYEKPASLAKDFISGMISGAFTSAALNPWDRAVYLSITNKRDFLMRVNFTKPYHGATQAIAQRAVFGSAYYLAQGQLRSKLVPYLRRDQFMPEPMIQMLVGVCAGSMHGFMTSSMALVKAQTWGNETNSFVLCVKNMYKISGYKAFMRGMTTSITRDAIHGSTYELCRHLLRDQVAARHTDRDTPRSLLFASDTVAAFAGTIASAPINYARSLKFATAPHLNAPSMADTLKAAWKDSKSHSDKPFGRLRFFQSRFCIGVTTMRAAVGMGLGQQVFDYMRTTMSKRD